MHFVSSILLLSLLTVNVVSDAEPGPVLNCDPPDPPGLQNGYKVSLIRSGILNSIAKFCHFYQGHNIPDKGIEAIHGPYGPKSKVEKNTQLITLRVKPVPGCSPWDDLVDFGFCQKALSILTDGCDTSTMLGKRGGSVDYKCVRWEIAGAGGADVYRLHLSQRMVGDWSEIEYVCHSWSSPAFTQTNVPNLTVTPLQMDHVRLERHDRRWTQHRPPSHGRALQTRALGR